jgi:hypothetical protein
MKHSLKIFVSLFFITLNCQSLFCQNQPPRVYIAYETANFTNDFYKDYLVREGNNTPSIKLGFDFNLTKLISLGGYFNYTRFAKPEPYTTTYILNGVEQQRNWFGFTKSNALTLGTKLYFNLIPLFYNERELKVDFYSTAQFALLYNNADKNIYVKTGITPEYGVGLGLGYSITKSIQAFGESTFGDFYNDKNLRWTFGVKYSL